MLQGFEPSSVHVALSLNHNRATVRCCNPNLQLHLKKASERVPRGHEDECGHVYNTLDYELDLFHKSSPMFSISFSQPFSISGYCISDSLIVSPSHVLTHTHTYKERERVTLQRYAAIISLGMENNGNICALFIF